MVEVERELSSAYGFVPAICFESRVLHHAVIAAEARLLGAVCTVRRPPDATAKGRPALRRGQRPGKRVLPGAPSPSPVIGRQSSLVHFTTLRCSLRVAVFGFRQKILTVSHARDSTTRRFLKLSPRLPWVRCFAPGGRPSTLQRSRNVLSPVALKIERPSPPDEWEQSAGPYLKSQPQPPPDFEPFSVLRDQLGFIPEAISRPDIAS